MSKCHSYSKTWEYEFNHFEKVIVNFNDNKPIHYESMNERTLGNEAVVKLCGYKNLGVLKTYCFSFPSYISDFVD